MKPRSASGVTTLRSRHYTVISTDALLVDGPQFVRTNRSHRQRRRGQSSPWPTTASYHTTAASGPERSQGWSNLSTPSNKSRKRTTSRHGRHGVRALVEVVMNHPKSTNLLFLFAVWKPVYANGASRSRPWPAGFEVVNHSRDTTCAGIAAFWAQVLRGLRIHARGVMDPPCVTSS